MGAGRKALVIANARDFCPRDERVSVVSKKMEIMKRAGIEAKELDLRKYFDKEDELAAFINAYGPDLIYAIGGNVFLLSTAYRLSGFDKIVLKNLEQDKYVYGGGSAGAMVTADTLKYYGHDSLVPEAVLGVYGVEAVLDGLGLINEYIIPHADVLDCLEATRIFQERMRSDGIEGFLLNQLSAIIVEEGKMAVLP